MINKQVIVDNGCGFNAKTAITKYTQMGYKLKKESYVDGAVILDFVGDEKIVASRTKAYENRWTSVGRK